MTYDSRAYVSKFLVSKRRRECLRLAKGATPITIGSEVFTFGK